MIKEEIKKIIKEEAKKDYYVVGGEGFEQVLGKGEYIIDEEGIDLIAKRIMGIVEKEGR